MCHTERNAVSQGGKDCCWSASTCQGHSPLWLKEDKYLLHEINNEINI